MTREAAIKESNFDFYNIDDPVLERKVLIVNLISNDQEITYSLLAHFDDIAVLKEIYLGNYSDILDDIKIDLLVASIVSFFSFLCVICFFDYLELTYLSLIPLIAMLILSGSTIVVILMGIKYSVIRKLETNEIKLDKDFARKYLIAFLVSKDIMDDFYKMLIEE